MPQDEFELAAKRRRDNVADIAGVPPKDREGFHRKVNQEIPPTEQAKRIHNSSLHQELSWVIFSVLNSIKKPLSHVEIVSIFLGTHPQLERNKKKH